MATSSEQFKYSTDEMEENRTASCSVCSEDGSYVPATHYCVDCELYYCRNCVKCHTKIPALKSHQVNDIDSPQLPNADGEAKERSDLPAEVLRCAIHHGKVIDTHCKDHDEVCCGTCALVKHRMCSTESIANVSRDFQSNPEANTCKDALAHVLIQLTEAKQTRTNNLDRIGKQKLELIETVDKYEDMIIAKVKELANISRKEIRTKYEEDKTALDMDVAALDAAMTTTIEYINKLKVHVPGNDLQLFATVQTCKAVTKDGQSLLQVLMKGWKEREIKFHCDKMLENTVDGIKSLGVLDYDCTIKEYEATFQNKVNVSYCNHSDIRDMCLVDTGDLLLTEFDIKTLKRYTTNLLYKDEIQFAGGPVAVCKIDKHDVAVRINNKTVHFVSVGQTMQLISSFTLAHDGYGVAYDAETREIFACEGNKVSVYSKSGNKLRSFASTTNKCKQVALRDNKNIYVTDGSCVVVLDKVGHLKMKVTLSGINNAWSLCLLPGNICLVGSQTPGRIVQIGEDGKLVGTLIDNRTGGTDTYCAVYDHDNSRLIVGGWPSVISVYKMSAKRS